MEEEKVSYTLPTKDTPIETSPDVPKKRLNWKGFFIAIVLVGLADWAVISMLQNENKHPVATSVAPTKTAPSPTIETTSPTKSIVADWQTYSNAEAHISFQYPKGWEVKVGKDGKTLGLGPVKDLGYYIAGPIQTNNPDTYMKDHYRSPYLLNISQQPYKSSIYSAVKYTLKYDPNAQASGPDETTVIIVNDKNDYYYFEQDGFQPGDNLEKIIASFRFDK